MYISNEDDIYMVYRYIYTLDTVDIIVPVHYSMIDIPVHYSYPRQEQLRCYLFIVFLYHHNNKIIIMMINNN